MAPPFLTSLGAITFNFTGFVDAHSGPLAYQWAVGSAPGRADVLPAMAYNGARRARGVACCPPANPDAALRAVLPAWSSCLPVRSQPPRLNKPLRRPAGTEVIRKVRLGATEKPMRWYLVVSH